MSDDVMVVTEEPVPEVAESVEAFAEKDAEVDNTLELIYAEAEKKGVNPASFTEEELSNILAPIESAKPSETDTVIKTPVAVVKEPKTETPVVMPPVEDATVYKQRYENLLSLKNRQDGELGSLRQMASLVPKELVDALRDPNLPGLKEHILAYFDTSKQAQPAKTQPQLDPDDPEYLSKLVDKRVNDVIEERERSAVAQRMQATQQQTINEFFAGLRDGTTAHVSTGRDANAVMQNTANFIERFKRGKDIPVMADIVANYEQNIAVARKQGAEEAIQKLKQDTIGIPKRTAVVSAKGKESAGSPRSINDIETKEELVDYMKNLDPVSAEYDAGLELALKRRWG